MASVLGDSVSRTRFKHCETMTSTVDATPAVKEVYSKIGRHESRDHCKRE